MPSARSLSGGPSASNATVRRRLLVLHRWLGLTAGLIFGIAAGTGAVLVYADDLDSLVGGPRFQATPGLIAPAEIQAAIERSAPDAHVVRVIWPANGSNVLNVRVNDHGRLRDLVLDAGTGVSLRPRPPHWLLATIRRMHTGLLMGPSGAVVVQLASVAALFSLVFGLCLWWPGLRHFARGFRIRLRRGLWLMNLDLHQTLGVLALPLLLVMTVSGVLMNGTAMEVVSRLVNGSEDLSSWRSLRSVPADPSTPETDLATVARRVGGEGIALTYVIFPARPDGVIEAGVVKPTGAGRGQRLRLALDRSSGDVLLAQPVLFDGQTNAALHFGTAFGPVVRAGYASSCIVGFSLLPTGFIVWRHRRRGRAVKAPIAA
jgi:uncharacterized iron-regulated membrane protein